MTFKNIVKKYWKDFEVIAFNLVKKELPQESIVSETLTQSIKDGGYDGEFLLSSDGNSIVKVLFEAKLRSDYNGSLPLQDFAKAIIISIVRQIDIIYIVTNIHFSENTVQILEDYSNFVPLGIKLANGLTVKKFLLSEEWSKDIIGQEFFDFLVNNNNVKFEQNIVSPKSFLNTASLYKELTNAPQTLEYCNLFDKNRGILTVTGNIGSGKSTFIDNLCFFISKKGKSVAIIDLSKCITYKDLFVEILEKTIGLSLKLVNQIDKITFKNIFLENEALETNQEDVQMLNFIFSKDTDCFHDYSYLFSIIVHFYEKMFSSKKRSNIIVAFKNSAYAHEEVLKLLLYFLKSHNTFSSIIELNSDIYLNGDVGFWDSFKQNVMSLATYQNFNVNDWSLEEAKCFLQKNFDGLSDRQLTSLINKFGRSPAELTDLIEMVDTCKVCTSYPQNLIYDEIMSLNPHKKDVLYHKCFEYLQFSNSSMLYLFALIYLLSGEVEINLLYEFINDESSFKKIFHLIQKSSLFYVNGRKISLKNSKIEEQLSIYCEEHLTAFVIRNVELFLRERLKTLSLSSEEKLEFKCKCEYYKSERKYLVSLINLGKAYLKLQQLSLAKKNFQKCIEILGSNSQVPASDTQRLQIYLGLVETLIWKIGTNSNSIERYLNMAKEIINTLDNKKSSCYLLTLKYYLLSYQFFHSQNNRNKAFDVAEKGVRFIEEKQLYNDDLEACGKMWRFYAVATKEQTQNIKKCLDVFDKGFVRCGNSAKFLFGYIIHKNMNIKGKNYREVIKIKLENYNELFKHDTALSIDEYLHYRVNVAALKFLQKDYKEAWKDYEMLLDKSIVFDIKREKIRILNDMANICWIENNLLEACKMYYTAKKEAERCGCIGNYWPILVNLVSFEVNKNNFEKAWDIHLILKPYLEQKCLDLLSTNLSAENQEYIKAAVIIHLKNLLKIYDFKNDGLIICTIKELYQKCFDSDNIQEKKLVSCVRKLDLKNTAFAHNGLFLIKN